MNHPATERINHMTIKQGYLVMFDVLDALFEEQKEDASIGLRELLSELSLDTFSDGQPADPAVWADWQMCVKKVCASENNIRPEELKPLMFTFLHYYMSEFGFELGDVIAALQNDPGLDLKLNAN